MLKNLYSIIIVVGAAVSTTTAIVSPNLFAASLAATGGALAGASTMSERRLNAEMRIREAAKVSTAFQQAYANNRGVIQAEEISIYGDVPMENAIAFLNALAAENNGQVLEGGNGTTYVFPHVENTLKALNDNAKNWAQAQVQQLQQENQNLRQALASIQQQQTAAVAAVANNMRRPATVQSDLNGENLWEELL